MFKVTFKFESGEDVTTFAQENENLLEVARKVNVAIDAPCGGNASCGKCKVKILEGNIDSPKTRHISDEEYNELFQGDDYNVRDDKGNITCGTMYIDLPNKQVARSSTASIETRQSFNYDETIEEVFKKSIIGW